MTRVGADILLSVARSVLPRVRRARTPPGQPLGRQRYNYNCVRHRGNPWEGTFFARTGNQANKNSFVLNSLILSLSLAAFSNSNRLAASRISLSNFAM
jgi:hypothetical protein